MPGYPPLRLVLGVTGLAFLLTQFLVYPLFAELNSHLGLMAAELVAVAIALFATRRRGWLTEDLLLLNATPARGLLAAPLAAAGFAIVVSDLDRRFAHWLASFDLGPPGGMLHFVLELQLIESPWAAVPVLVSVVALPAICEEAFFRGFALTSLRFHCDTIVAVVVSALLFATVHVNPWQFPALFLIGVFLAVVVMWTHSVYPAVLAHAANNLLSVVAVNVRAHTGVDWLGAMNPVPLVVWICGAVALVVGLLWLRTTVPVMPLLSPYALRDVSARSSWWTP
ncbi:MAG: type II CAAX endopeptidase family protein [Candidatus Latescibacterota bacterium]|nr:type II CAAX endopeptidase family protein [Candidatus Latescibacterota bacterium]